MNREISIEFVRCRADGHHWTHELTQVQGREVVRMLRCAQCSGERHDLVTRSTGEIVRRLYRMPKGYRLVGQGRQPRQIFRKAVVVVELEDMKKGSAA